jgi:hypothetical protein
MRTGRALLVVLAFVVAATVSPAVAHTGGSNGYAAITIDRTGIRYSLTLWPATLPPAVAEQIQRARAGHAASRDHLLGFIRDKVTLMAQGRRCEAGPASLRLGPSPTESLTLVVDFT